MRRGQKPPPHLIISASIKVESNRKPLSTMKKSTRRIQDFQRKREEDQLKQHFMGHVPENKRTKEMISSLVDRLKSFKI